MAATAEPRRAQAEAEQRPHHRRSDHRHRGDAEGHRTASSSSSLANRSGYQSRVNPLPRESPPTSLNEKMTSTTIGANRNA